MWLVKTINGYLHARSLGATVWVQNPNLAKRYYLETWAIEDAVKENGVAVRVFVKFKLRDSREKT